MFAEFSKLQAQDQEAGWKMRRKASAFNPAALSTGDNRRTILTQAELRRFRRLLISAGMPYQPHCTVPSRH
jgi:hypothetical protein